MRSISCRLIYAVPLLLASMIVHAEISDSGTEREIYGPTTGWRLSMPRQDWIITDEKRGGGGTLTYYLMSSESRTLFLSVFIEKSSKCKSGPSCSDLVLSNPAYKNRKDFTHSQAGGFTVSQFWLEVPYNDTLLKQRNAHAEAYLNGYWIDVHLSSIGKKLPDAKLLMDVINSLKIQQEPAGMPAEGKKGAGGK